jgi:hypothetical protein
VAAACDIAAPPVAALVLASLDGVVKSVLPDCCGVCDVDEFESPVPPPLPPPPLPPLPDVLPLPPAPEVDWPPVAFVALSFTLRGIKLAFRLGCMWSSVGERKEEALVSIRPIR